MKLRVKQTASIMMILSIDKFTCKGKIFGSIICASANTYSGKFFQLTHSDIQSFAVSVNQTSIKNRHNGYRFLRRTLKIIKANGMRIITRSQLLFGNGVYILLKQRENLLRHSFTSKIKSRNEPTFPVAIDFIMLTIVVITRKMIPIKIGSFSMRSFNFSSSKQNTFPHPEKMF